MIATLITPPDPSMLFKLLSLGIVGGIVVIVATLIVVLFIEYLR